MKTSFIPILLCATLALAAAIPWYSRDQSADSRRKGYYDNDGYFHLRGAAHEAQMKAKSSAMPRARAAAVKEAENLLCQSSSFEYDRIDHKLHVCPGDQKGEYCYIAAPPLPRCCSDIPPDATPIREVLYTLVSGKVPVEFYPGRSPSRGACFRLDESIEVCSGCSDPSCVDVDCQMNMDASGSCLEGYQPPDCCNCAPNYYRNSSGRCEPVCNDFCAVRPITEEAGCTQCLDGYVEPRCCDCEDGYLETPQNTCEPPVCPNGLTSFSVCTGGVCTCQAGYTTEPNCCYCEKGVGSCDSNGQCTCSPEYSGQDCCDCADGFVRNSDGDCVPPVCPNGLTSFSVCTGGVCRCQAGYTTEPNCCYCEKGVREGSCNANGECACKEGYRGPTGDCCECEDGLQEIDDNCVPPVCPDGLTSFSVCTGGVCTCQAGYTTEPNCCYCANGTDLNTCDSSGNCDCREGFGGPGCCVASRCADQRDIYFAIDWVGAGHRSQPHHCYLAHTMELLPNIMGESKFEVVLYPNVQDASSNNPAIRLFDTSATCREAVGKLLTMSDAVASYDRRYYQLNGLYPNREDRQKLDPFSQLYNDYKNPARQRFVALPAITSRRRYPGQALNLIRDDIIRGGGISADPKIPQIVILFVTGELEEFNNGIQDPANYVDTTAAVEELLKEGASVIIGFYRHSDERQHTKDWLDRMIALSQKESRLHVIRREDREVNLLLISIVRYMESQGFICAEHAREVLRQLEREQAFVDQCACLMTRYTVNAANYRGMEKCEPKVIRCENEGEFECGQNEWDALSPITQGKRKWDSREVDVEYQPDKFPRPTVEIMESDHDKGKLEKEILAAVEDILEERLG